MIGPPGPARTRSGREPVQIFLDNPLLFALMGLSPHKLEVPGHKRLEMEFGQPIHEIMA